MIRTYCFAVVALICVCNPLAMAQLPDQENTSSGASLAVLNDSHTNLPAKLKAIEAMALPQTPAEAAVLLDLLPSADVQLISPIIRKVAKGRYNGACLAAMTATVQNEKSEPERGVACVNALDEMTNEWFAQPSQAMTGPFLIKNKAGIIKLFSVFTLRFELVAQKGDDRTLGTFLGLSDGVREVMGEGELSDLLPFLKRIVIAGLSSKSTTIQRRALRLLESNLHLQRLNMAAASMTIADLAPFVSLASDTSSPAGKTSDSMLRHLLHDRAPANAADWPTWWNEHHQSLAIMELAAQAVRQQDRASAPSIELGIMQLCYQPVSAEERFIALTTILHSTEVAAQTRSHAANYLVQLRFMDDTPAAVRDKCNRELVEIAQHGEKEAAIVALFALGGSRSTQQQTFVLARQIFLDGKRPDEVRATAAYVLSWSDRDAVAMISPIKQLLEQFQSVTGPERNQRAINILTGALQQCEAKQKRE